MCARVSASSPLVGFGKLNDNTIKGLTNLLSVKQEIKLLHTLVDCRMRSVYRFNKKANLMIFHIMFKSRPKLCIVVLEDHENNIIQAEDNNENGIVEMAPILWISLYHEKGSIFGKW